MDFFLHGLDLLDIFILEGDHLEGSSALDGVSLDLVAAEHTVDRVQIEPTIDFDLSDPRSLVVRSSFFLDAVGNPQGEMLLDLVLCGAQSLTVVAFHCHRVHLVDRWPVVEGTILVQARWDESGEWKHRRCQRARVFYAAHRERYHPRDSLMQPT